MLEHGQGDLATDWQPGIDVNIDTYVHTHYLLEFHLIHHDAKSSNTPFLSLIKESFLRCVYLFIFVFHYMDVVQRIIDNYEKYALSFFLFVSSTSVFG